MHKELVGQPDLSREEILTKVYIKKALMVNEWALKASSEESYLIAAKHCWDVNISSCHRNGKNDVQGGRSPTSKDNTVVWKHSEKKDWCNRWWPRKYTGRKTPQFPRLCSANERLHSRKKLLFVGYMPESAFMRIFYLLLPEHETEWWPSQFYREKTEFPGRDGEILHRQGPINDETVNGLRTFITRRGASAIWNHRMNHHEQLAATELSAPITDTLQQVTTVNSIKPHPLRAESKLSVWPAKNWPPYIQTSLENSTQAREEPEHRTDEPSYWWIHGETSEKKPLEGKPHDFPLNKSVKVWADLTFIRQKASWITFTRILVRSKR